MNQEDQELLNALIKISDTNLYSLNGAISTIIDDVNLSGDAYRKLYHANHVIEIMNQPQGISIHISKN